MNDSDMFCIPSLKICTNQTLLLQNFHHEIKSILDTNLSPLVSIAKYFDKRESKKERFVPYRSTLGSSARLLRL